MFRDIICILYSYANRDITQLSLAHLQWVSRFFSITFFVTEKLCEKFIMKAV